MQDLKRTMETKMLADKVYDILAKDANITYNDVDMAELEKM